MRTKGPPSKVDRGEGGTALQDSSGEEHLFGGVTLLPMERVFLLSCIFSLVLSSGACGLFQTEPVPPSANQVARARQAASEEWTNLAEMLQLYEQEGMASVETAYVNHSWSIREAVLMQDLRFVSWSNEPGRWRAHYLAERNQYPSALSLYLYSRTLPSGHTRNQALKEVLREDPGLIQARVDWLALRDFQAEDESVLDAMLQLLNEDPGLAEAWQVLAEQAPLHQRWDLVRAAAETGSWLQGEGNVKQDLAEREAVSIRALLADGHPEEAFEQAKQPTLDPGDARFFQAAALADLGNAERAFLIIQEAKAENPEDPWVWFNLGILAKDYLNQPQLAREAFTQFLLLADQPNLQAPYPVSFAQRLQAESWLRALSTKP